MIDGYIIMNTVQRMLRNYYLPPSAPSISNAGYHGYFLLTQLPSLNLAFEAT